MTDRPILFSAPMVRAILAGTKTQTRRAIKPLPLRVNRGTNEMEVDTECMTDGRIMKLNRFGQPGDRLWCRETYRLDAQFDSLAPRDVPANSPYFMEASRSRWEGGPHDGIPGKLRPAIHMPRWASRITLDVTGVRVERLQDISEADAIAEGIERSGNANWRDYLDHPYNDFTSARRSYRSLWESINGPGSWAANPWVWVVSFRRLP